MLLYRVLLVVDAVAIALFVALASRDFGSERIGDSASILWAVAAVAAILLGNSVAPKRRAYLIVADVVLLLIALPAVLMAFLVVAFTINPSHH
jgi:hypothetical protein